MNRLAPLLLVLGLAASCGTVTPDPIDGTAESATGDTDSAAPDAEPDVQITDTPAADTARPDTATPDVTDPDAAADVPVDPPGEDAPSDLPVEDADVVEPDVGEPDTPEPDAHEPDSGEPDAPEPDTGDGRMCTSDDSGFPDFRGGCREASDCTQAFHQVDCCGTFAAIAVLRADHEEFLSTEERCRGEYDRCRCAARPTQTDDGVVVSELTDFDVACEGGRCISVGRRGTEGVVCTDRVPTTFPGFDNSCVEYDDCVAVAHQHDCCGNMHMVGINRTSLEAFEAAETDCRAEYPACGCPVGPLTTDAGTDAWEEGIVEAMCREGICWTYVPL